MARRAKHPALVALAAAVLAATAMPADAHNVHEGAYRKWPWRAGKERVLTTLPGECPHCPGVQSSSSWKAIDVDMNYETVYSIGPGRIERYEPSGGGAGKYIRVADDDGTYFVYEHLSQALVTSGRVVAGEPIAISGCTGNCSGAHLHFQRNDAVGFSSNALSLARISGHGGSADPFDEVGYDGDNAGIGYRSDGVVVAAMQDAYEAQGGFDRVGASADLGEAWSPCRAQGVTGTWWRYMCAPTDRFRGSVQTFLGPGERPRALMHAAGSSRAYLLHRGILAAYTELMGGLDWVSWIGYPTGNRARTPSGLWRQEFQDGHVLFDEDVCRVSMYLRGTLMRTYTFCD